MVIRSRKGWVALVDNRWQHVSAQHAREIIARFYGWKNIEEVFCNLARHPIEIHKRNRRDENVYAAPKPTTPHAVSTI